MNHLMLCQVLQDEAIDKLRKFLEGYNVVLDSDVLRYFKNYNRGIFLNHVVDNCVDEDLYIYRVVSLSESNSKAGVLYDFYNLFLELNIDTERHVYIPLAIDFEDGVYCLDITKEGKNKDLKVVFRDRKYKDILDILVAIDFKAFLHMLAV